MITKILGMMLVSVKSNVQRKLEENRGTFFSGEDLAAELKVSRAAVWKAVNQLKKEGNLIEALPNKGYRLGNESDILSVEGIRTYLNSEYKNNSIVVDQVTGSTNQNCKLWAANHGKEGSLFVANEQTAGRGRRGRDFVSMQGNAIYMSLLLKPKINASDAVFMTTAASVAVYRAILKVTGKQTKIKWVNDLFYENKKVCGILTEAVTDCESGMIDSIIIGIGINFNIAKDMVPENLKEIAGALYDGDSKGTSRNELIGEVVNQLMMLCTNLSDRSFLEDYRENSMVLGKTISVLSQDGPKSALAYGVDDNGGLMVRYPDGTTEILSTGEISIRLK